MQLTERALDGGEGNEPEETGAVKVVAVDDSGVVDLCGHGGRRVEENCSPTCRQLQREDVPARGQHGHAEVGADRRARPARDAPAMEQLPVRQAEDVKRLPAGQYGEFLRAKGNRLRTVRLEAATQSLAPPDVDAAVGA